MMSSSSSPRTFRDSPAFGFAPLALAPDVARLRNWFANLYFYAPGGPAARSWVLVDAGLPGSAHVIRRLAAEFFGPDSRPEAIILTHGHFDHVGALPGLIASGWGDVPIYAHGLELPYLTGRADYLPPDPTVGEAGLLAWMSPLYPRRAIDLGGRVKPLPGDGSVPAMPGWRWVHTPGHSPGHVSLFREADRTLLAGDAFVTVYAERAWSVLRGAPEVRRPPAYFTPDWDQARQSVQVLAALEPALAATGHGQPMAGAELLRELQGLSRAFETVGLPSHGRYVGKPGRTVTGAGVTFETSRGRAGGLGPLAIWSLLGFLLAWVLLRRGDRAGR